jgi:hypothetical protein
MVPEFNYYFPEESQEEEIKNNGGEAEEVNQISLTIQDLFPSSIFQNDGIEILLTSGTEKILCDLRLEKVEEPSPDVLIKAHLQVTNEKIFQII